MKISYRRRGRLEALCLAAAFIVLSGCQGQQSGVPGQSASVPNAAAPAGCVVPTAFSATLAEPIAYRAAPAGLRLITQDSGYIQIIRTGRDHMVSTINAANQPFGWAEGIFGMGDGDVLDHPEALTQALWPLTIGKQITFSEHSPRRSVNHVVTVRSFDTIKVGEQSIPVVWIDDHNTSSAAIDGDFDTTYAVAYAPDLGVILAINAQANGASKVGPVGWVVTKIAPCDSSASKPVPTVDALRERVKANDADAMLELGRRLVDGRGVARDPTVGAALYERAANAGNAEAQTLIGECYIAGLGVAKDPATGVMWLQKAADQHFARAENDLAAALHGGLGIARDDARAFRLMQAAAEQGTAVPMAGLGSYYALGVGTTPDPKLAKEWLLKATREHNLYASAMLGRLYRDGTFGSADLVAAYAWFDVAAGWSQTDRDRNAITAARDDLALILPPDDVERARALALHWLPGKDFASAVPAKTAATSAAAPQTSTAASSIAAVPAPTAVPPKADAQEHPIVEKLLKYDVHVEPDASSTAIIHLELSALNQSAASNLGQLPIRYKDLVEEVEILEAYTLKKDGRKLAVEPSAIYAQLVPGAPNVPMFDDQKQKVIVFPDVEAGDLIVYTARFKSKPMIPGMYSLSYNFPRSFPVTEAHVTITTPKSLPLVTESHEIQFDSHASGNEMVYEWQYANTTPIAEDVIALDAFDRFPRLFASTLPNHAALGVAYANLIKAKLEPTPKLKALADQITEGVTNRRVQAERIYRWVGEHIRYVGIELGQGGYIPHDAQLVLDNGYGDCKDHTILFSTLLAAKGIKSEVVLINLGNNYALAAPPTLSNFNHVISWLPEFQLYADTTAGVAPFGVLPWSEYGKQVVHARIDGAIVNHVPVLAPGVATVALKTVARLGADGSVTGDSTLTTTGPYSLNLREDLVYIEKTGPTEAARNFLKSTGIEGTGQFDAGSPYDPKANSLHGHFDLNAIDQRVNGSSFFIPAGFELFGQPGNSLMGPKALLRLSPNEPTACFSGSESEEISLELPKGKHLREVPPNKEIKTDNLVYRSTWSYKDHIVSLRREFTSTINVPVCVGKVRADTAKALNDIRGDSHTSIAVVSD